MLNTLKAQRRIFCKRRGRSARAAALLDRGDFARKEVSMAKIQVADRLHRAVDTAIQLCGARRYSRDAPLEKLTATRGKPAKSMVPQKFTRWLWRAPSSPKRKTSGLAERVMLQHFASRDVR